MTEGYYERAIGLVSAQKIEAEKVEFPQTAEMSWMLGYLSSSASFNVSKGNSCEIKFPESCPERAELLNIYSQELFQYTPHKKVKSKWDNQYYEYAIYSAKTLRNLGDLSRDNAPETIQTRYAWVFDNPDLIWKFIEGLYEAKGSIGTNSVLFTGDNPTYQIFVLELLERVGISDAHLQFVDSKRTQINGVAVRSWSSLKKIAENIHSVHPESIRKFESILAYKPREWAHPTTYDLKTLYRTVSERDGVAPSLKKFAGYLKALEMGVSESTIVRILGNGSYPAARLKLREFTENNKDSQEEAQSEIIEGHNENQADEMETGECVHRWILEPPNGTNIVEGHCTKCKALKEFKVSLPEMSQKEISLREFMFRNLKEGLPETI